LDLISASALVVDLAGVRWDLASLSFRGMAGAEVISTTSISAIRVSPTSLTSPIIITTAGMVARCTDGMALECRVMPVGLER
jgi:hypothetical protein